MWQDENMLTENGGRKEIASKEKQLITKTKYLSEQNAAPLVSVAHRQ